MLYFEQDDFHNGRTIEQLRGSFKHSQRVVNAIDQQRCLGTARTLSDGICNCYVVDVRTQSQIRYKVLQQK